MISNALYQPNGDLWTSIPFAAMAASVALSTSMARSGLARFGAEVRVRVQHDLLCLDLAEDLRDVRRGDLGDGSGVVVTWTRPW